MIDRFNAYIPYLDEMRQIDVYLPDDYYTSEEVYPVMVMYDGQNLFNDEEATYGKSWGLRTFLDRYEKKMIIVGIECSTVGNHRIVEFCPYRADTSFAGLIEGTGDQFNNWICYELKPYVESHYRVYHNRECWGIGGSSMGGLMSVHMILAHNDAFSKAACLSPSLYSCMNELLGEMHHIEPDTRVYLSTGENEQRSKKMLTVTANHFSKIGHELNKRGASFMFHILENGDHNEASWERLNGEYLGYLWLNR